MIHRFYQKPDAEQTRIIWKIGGLLFVLCSSIIVISYLSGLYLLGWLIPVLLLVAAPFIDLPEGRKSGKFIYYSPLFITEPEKSNKVVVHGGTLFDYFYTITPDLKGRERTKFVLYGYTMGLIHFISEHEKHNNQDLRIRGTSYILNQQTAARFGLKPVKTDVVQFLILLLNYIPITISYSFIKQRLHFPKISKIKTYEGELSELIRHKEKLFYLKRQLEPKKC